MKKILFIFIAVLISINVGATKYYIDPTGVDDAGRNGLTTGTAWASLSYACTRATTAGDTIFVNAGTYTETVMSELAVGVSIIGEGITSIIKAGDVFRPLLKLASGVEGTDGNQSISYVNFDGNDTANSIIEIYARSNVKIHHCWFYDSVKDGVLFFSKVNRGEGLITTYSENNAFYNNYVYNCSHFGAYGGWEWNTNHYGLGLGGQKNMLIHHNTIIQPDMGADAEGVCIGFTGWGQNCGTKIYNNTLHAMPRQSSSTATGGWGFAIELWTQRGGVEIYNNDIKGAIDFGGYDSNDDEGYGYAIKVYGNRIGFDAVSQYTSWGILLENGIQGGVYIYRNIIENASIAITLHVLATALVKTIENINVYYNIFKNIRKDGASPPYGYAMQIYSDEVSPFTNLNICNNVFETDQLGYFYSILQCNDGVTAFSHINIKNNIGVHINQPVRITTGTIDFINIENNDMYNCGATLWNFTGCTVTNATIQNNITDDPLFVGGSPYSYKLQSTSPARDAGISVGLTTDYGGYSVPVGPLPDIGAWEYGSDVTPPNWHPTGLGWDDIYFKNNFRDTVNFTVPPTIAGAPLNLAALLPSGLTATVNDLNATQGATGNLQGQINALKASGGDSKANTSLSNLSSVAINTHLLPDTAGTINLGSGAKPFAKIFGGSTIVSDLSIGDSTSNTIAKFDSVSVFNGKLYAFVNGDTIGWGVLTADSEDITDHVIMKIDTVNGSSNNDYVYSKYQIDTMTFAGFTSGFDSVYIYAKVDSLINIVGEQQSQIELLWAAIDSLGLGDFRPPTFLSAEVGTFNDSILVVILNDTDVQQDSIPAVGAFTVKENGSAMGIEAIDIGNDTVYISLDALAIEGYTYTVSYNKDFDYPQLQDSSENITPSFTKRTVTNNVFDAFPSIASVTETLTNNSDRTSHPITMPAEVDEGDLLLVFFACDFTSISTLAIDVANTDDGWTLESYDAKVSTVGHVVLWKIADSDGDTLTITTSEPQISVAQTYRITNFDPSDPIKTTYSTDVSQYPDPPTNTGDYAADDYLWIVSYGADTGASYATAAPADFTGLKTTYVDSAGSCSLNSAYRKYNINGAYDPGTFTANTTNEEWVSNTVIVNPIQ